MRSKKMIGLFVFLGMVSLFVFSQSPVKAAQKGAQSAPAKPKADTVVTFASSPSYWIAPRVLESVLGQVISENTPYRIKFVGGYGPGGDRMRALYDGKILLSAGNMSSSRTIMKMVNQKNDPEMANNFVPMILFPAIPIPIPLVVYKDLPINTFGDLKTKKPPLKINTGSTGAFVTTDLIWKALGFEEGVRVVEKWGGMVEDRTVGAGVPDILREGTVNAFMSASERYFAGLEEVNRVKPLKVIPYAETDAEIQSILKLGIDVDRYVMKAGYYTFVTKDTNMVVRIWPIMTSAKLPEQIAYDITKSVWANREFLQKANPDLRLGLQPEVVKQSKDIGMKFHPGAERFFKDAGVLK